MIVDTILTVLQNKQHVYDFIYNKKVIVIANRLPASMRLGQTVWRWAQRDQKIGLGHF